MNALPSFVTILFDAEVFGKGVEVTVLASLKELLGAYGIEMSDERCELLLRHLDLLMEKNKSMNLTRVTSLEDAMVAHVLDSLLPLPYLSQLNEGSDVSLLDIGTGGGFPGLPLACVTEWDVTLIDSVGKKVAAVQGFIEEMGLGERVRAIHVRAEDLAKVEPGAYDLVVTRAVAQSNVLIEYASPLLRLGGHLVLYKARPSEDEISTAERAAKICGMTFVSRETFELPEDVGHRELFHYERTGNPDIPLPRRVGLAAKEPLGLC